MKLYKIQVFGKVQGVYFRASTRLKAIELLLKGYVENRKDGSVYIEAEGTEDQVKLFLEWCKNGPPGADVTKIHRSEGPLCYYTDFIIRR